MLENPQEFKIYVRDNLANVKTREYKFSKPRSVTDGLI
jgi:hypothetical protein